MRCPTDCDVDLLITERQGVEIDYCPRCRGVWLDRGELDKILDRASDEVGRIVERERNGERSDLPEWSSEYDERGRDRWASSSGSRRRDDDDDDRPKKKKRKKDKKQRAFDLLEDIFDF
ncbi:MAG: zf-TFIIB domain-containing protein [Actinomycetota bacterium]